MPVYNGVPKWLKCAINSVLAQSYTNWELCIVDDAPTNSNTTGVLSGIQDCRIRVRLLNRNVGISSATNEALYYAKGEYITFLDQDDELTKDALSEMVTAIVRYHPDLIYSDEDKFSDKLFRRTYLDAHFKPDYSPDLLLSHNYITHLLVIRSDLLESIGTLRSEFDGAQDYDLALRAVEPAEKICHIRKVLYHWRYHPGSASHEPVSRVKCSDAGMRAVAAALKRRERNATVGPTSLPNHYQVHRAINGEPLVSIIIPFSDNPGLLETCLSSIISKTTYPSYEVLGISNNSSQETTFDLMKQWSRNNQRVRFFEYNVPFNYSAINNFAVGLANGEYLVLLNNDTEIITPGWVEALLEHAQREEIGAVGGKLLYPDGTVQHAGIVVGIKGFAGRPHRRSNNMSTGYFHRLVIARNVSAVTGAMMMVSKGKYQQVGGLDSTHLPISLNDVDFCLRLMEQGLWNVFTPYCEAVHTESVSRGFDTGPGKNERFQKEIRFFTQRHHKILETGDPFYNPNLSLKDENIRYSPHPSIEHHTGCYWRKSGYDCFHEDPSRLDRSTWSTGMTSSTRSLK
ncbi:MAG: glycosyltransferase [Methanomicrobiales archaeon]